ncbi:hypothetical protein [Streptosporangium sp. NPDC000396]|uniref:hypothetical protein n=1 Tax=Streptosporangium sp. NPDC000396 TaxID=3366185 RepID=UPI003688ACB9
MIVRVITAVGQFQRDLQNELTAEGVAAAEAEGRYRGRPPALTGDRLADVRSAYTDHGTSIAAPARTHAVSRDAPDPAGPSGLLAPDGHRFAIRDKPLAQWSRIVDHCPHV